MFSSVGKDLLWVSLLGGEPFIRDDLAEIVAGLVSVCPNLFQLSIGTNGIESERVLGTVRTILKNLPAKVELYVPVSLDGPEEVHDRLRGVKGAYARSAHTFDELSALAERYSNLTVLREITLSAENLEVVPDLVRSLEGDGIHCVVTFAQDAPLYNLHEKVGLSSLPRRRVLDLIHELIPAMGWASDRARLMRSFFLRLAPRFFKDPEHQIIPCHSGWASVNIDPYGGVHPCIMIDESFGSLRSMDYDLGTVIGTSETRSIRDRIRQDDCPHCWTPCESYQTMAQEPLRTGGQFIREMIKPSSP